jgi:D-alanine transfer protein
MLDYPETLRHDMVLTLAVRNLARGGLPGRLKYALIYPLGQLEALVIRMQDHYAVWEFIQAHPEIDPVPAFRSEPIDWARQLADAEAEQKTATSNNSYGFENEAWVETYHQKVETRPAGSDDQQYLARVKDSKEWGDLQLVLEIFRETGARPMILSRPIHGPLYEAAGISPHAQQVFYNKLEQVVGSYHYPLADFKEYTGDTLFSIDGASHTSRKGWVQVDRTLDAFYHDQVH